MYKFDMGWQYGRRSDRDWIDKVVQDEIYFGLDLGIGAVPEDLEQIIEDELDDVIHLLRCADRIGDEDLWNKSLQRIRAYAEQYDVEAFFNERK